MKGIKTKYLSNKLERVTSRFTPLRVDHNPHGLFIPSASLDNSGGLVPAKMQTTFCIYCNSERVVPMRMPGFTLYECLYCREKWRDSYDGPRTTMRSSDWRDRRKKLGNQYGRILI
jgi:hypothetical protein